MDIELVLALAAFAFLMALSAFFSSSETSLFSLSRVQIEQMRQAGNPKIKLIERLLAQPRQLIVTILIGNELVNVAASVISAAIVIRVLGSDSKWVNLLIMVPILLLVGEITPKTLAIRNNVAFATKQCRFVYLFQRAIGPLRWAVRHVSDFFITMLIGKERSRANILTEDMVRSLTQEAVGDGALDREEARYINRIFDFGEKVLREIMTPRSQIVSLPASATLEEAAHNYQRTSHTKVPVFAEDKETVVGVLFSRDLVDEDLEGRSPAGKTRHVTELMREAYFVPETKSVADLFYTFRRRKLSLALTVDEYGGVTGLVTMEDLLECIFGEIISPSELLRQGALDVQAVGENAYRMDGAMTLQQFNHLLGSALESDSAETIGGLLLHAFGELPEENSKVVVDELEFTVETVVGHRIGKVTVRPTDPSQAMEGPKVAAEPAESRTAGPGPGEPAGRE